METVQHVTETKTEWSSNSRVASGSCHVSFVSFCVSRFTGPEPQLFQSHPRDSNRHRARCCWSSAQGSCLCLVSSLCVLALVCDVCRVPCVVPSLPVQNSAQCEAGVPMARRRFLLCFDVWWRVVERVWRECNTRVGRIVLLYQVSLTTRSLCRLICLSCSRVSV